MSWFYNVNVNLSVIVNCVTKVSRKKSCCSFVFCPNYLLIQTYDIQLCGLSSDGSSIFSNHLSTQLLPGRILLSKYLTKSPKVKTRVVRRTLDPVYDEDFTFYGIHFNQLPVSFKILEHVQLCWPTALPRVWWVPGRGIVQLKTVHIVHLPYAC